MPPDSKHEGKQWFDETVEHGTILRLLPDGRTIKGDFWSSDDHLFLEVEIPRIDGHPPDAQEALRLLIEQEVIRQEDKEETAGLMRITDQVIQVKLYMSREGKEFFKWQNP